MKNRNLLYSLCRQSIGFVACCACLFLSVPSDADEAAGRWYKGQTHVHTLWSDGDEFPEMVADWYKSQGYDFLAITDHNVLMEGERWRNVGWGKKPKPISLGVVEKCQNRFGADWMVFRGEKDRREVKLKTFDEINAKLGEPGKFLLIQGEEITQGQAHVNALNLAELIPPTPKKPSTPTIVANLLAVEGQSRRLNRPILAHFNHPNWKYYITPEELAASPAKFFEVCTGGPKSNNNHYGDATHPGVEKLWDIVNTIRIAKMKAPPLLGLATDDAHYFHEFTPKKSNPGRAWIMVRATDLSVESLFDAMNRGDFYATTGVTLSDVSFNAEQGVLAVKVQAERGVKYAIEFIGTLEGVDPEGMLGKKNKNTQRAGQTYSPEVGKVLARVQGASAKYRLTGRELYVRAVVRSDKSTENPTLEGVQRQEAWCQPVGWRK